MKLKKRTLQIFCCTTIRGIRILIHRKIFAFGVYLYIVHALEMGADLFISV